MTITPTLPPHSDEAEQSLLGGLLLDNSAWDLIVDVLCSEDFFRAEHRLIFRAIESLASQNAPFDVVTLAEKLESQPEAGGLAYLGELAKNIPSVANIHTYAQIIRDRAHRRRLMQFGFACYREANEPDESATQLQERFEQRLFSLGQHLQSHDFIDMKQCLATVIDEIDRHFNAGSATTGLPSGLTALDEQTAGFQPADLIIVAARPSMGKTSLALCLLEGALLARPQHSVQLYSLEMPARALVYRLLAIFGRLSLSSLLKGTLHDDDWPRLSAAVGKLSQLGERLIIDDTPALTCAALRARARQASRRFGMPSLVMIDYLQLMRSSPKENRNLEITEITGALKALAKELSCPVIALSQLNRALEQRSNKRPLLSDLRESGAIEQDADLILFVYRDEVYHPDTEARGTAELIIGKHRNGPTGTVHCAFLPEQARFAPLTGHATWRPD